MGEIEVGQVYEEVDSRFKRTVMVVRCNPNGTKVMIVCAESGRHTWADKKRFNGKNRGYRLIADNMPSKHPPVSLPNRREGGASAAYSPPYTLPASCNGGK